MTVQTLTRAIKQKKPAVIRQRGVPRYVVVDWKTYCTWEVERENLEDATRLLEALADPRNQKRVPLSRVRKLLHLS